MRPYTLKEPKPLLAPAGKPMLLCHLEALREAGVPLAVVNACYLGERIERYVSAIGPRLRGMRTVCAREPGPSPLETGGGAVYALEALGRPEAFFALNSDMLYPCGEAALLRRLAALWRSLPPETDALLALQTLTKSRGYDGSGDFGLSAEGKALRRPVSARTHVFPGVQIIRASALLRAAEEAGAEAWPLRVLYERAAAEGRLRGTEVRLPWLHIGDPAALASSARRLRIAEGGRRAKAAF